MGSTRNQKNRIKHYIILLILLPILSLNSCYKKEDGSAAILINSWVKKHYFSEAKTILSGPLEIAFPDIQAFRGSIQWEEKQIDGIFFINKKDHSIQFFNAKADKSEENP